MTQLQTHSPRDRYRIDMSDERDVRYWIYALGVSRETLAEAIETVGVKVDDVRVFLGKRVTRASEVEE